MGVAECQLRQWKEGEEVEGEGFRQFDWSKERGEEEEVFPQSDLFPQFDSQALPDREGVEELYWHPLGWSCGCHSQVGEEEEEWTPMLLSSLHKITEEGEGQPSVLMVGEVGEQWAFHHHCHEEEEEEGGGLGWDPFSHQQGGEEEEGEVLSWEQKQKTVQKWQGED